MSAREDIATAASTVEGITAHPYFVDSTHPGTAYVRLDRTEWPNRFGGVCHWNLVVILPEDMAQAERFVEQNLPLIKAAVEEHLVVTSAVPQRLELTGIGVLPCLFINGHRED